VNDHIKGRTWPGSGQNGAAFCRGGVRGNVHLTLSDLGRRTSFDASSSSGSGCFTGSLRNIGRNMSLNYRKIGESSQVSIANSFYDCPEMTFRFSVCPNTNEEHGSYHPCTLHAAEAPCEVVISTRIFSFACASLVHLRSTRFAFSFGIQIGGFPFVRCDSDHIKIVQSFPI
jgi:hypothetical protein